MLSVFPSIHVSKPALRMRSLQQMRMRSRTRNVNLCLTCDGSISYAAKLDISFLSFIHVLISQWKADIERTCYGIRSWDRWTQGEQKP